MPCGSGLIYFFSFLAISANAQEESANIVNLNLVNRRKWLMEPGNVYIGRETWHLSGSKWGNPHKIDLNDSRKNSREKVIELFKIYILNNAELLESITELQGKKLGCWCAPKQCHGEILHQLAGNNPIYQTL